MVLVVWTLLEQSLNCLLFPEWNRFGIFCGKEEKIALPPFGGNGGPGKIISPVARVQYACATRLFLLDHRTTCTVFLVFVMFAMATMADSCTLPPYPRLQALRPVEHIFHCLSNVWFFRQAHKRPTNLDDQFLEILTCWTRWQASFFIILKGKTSKPGQMSSSLRKSLKRKKFGKNKSLGKKSYARRVIMQSLKSIRLAEVDNFFKQSFEQKKLIPL